MGVSIRAKRRNTAIRKLSGQTVTLIEKIQQQRLSWFGHTERMGNERLPLKALHTLMEGTRSRGRHRKRCGLTTSKKT
jgi:hypothetical protein